MEALFREAVEKILPFTDSKTLLKIPKLTPMVRFQTAPGPTRKPKITRLSS